MNIKQHLFVCRPGFSEELAAEFKARWQIESSIPDRYSVLVGADAVGASEIPEIEATVFVRQILPRAQLIQCKGPADVVSAVTQLVEKTSKRANRKTGRWTLHVFAADDNEAGKFCSKLEKPILKDIGAKLGSFNKRFVSPDAVASEPAKSDLIIQVFANSGTSVWISAASIAAGVSQHTGGNLRMKEVKGAPSRSSRKLEEAFGVLGRSPSKGETAVDLGAAPGGWSLSLAVRGADVTAVDHAELALRGVEKLPGTITHVKENGLKYVPDSKVDWLCCDMVLPANESLKVLKKWIESDLMGSFVVNIKLPRERAWPSVAKTLDLLEGHSKKWSTLKARHLYHDRHEITVMGTK